MASNVDEAYTAPEFRDDTKQAVFDISSADSTELWLIHMPKSKNQDFGGQVMTYKIREDGTLGRIDDKSGKDYEVVSFGSQAPNAIVFLSSESGSKIVGKLSRQVSLVHYSEPQELEEQDDLKKMYQQASASKSSSKYETSAHRRTKSTLSEAETPKRMKKKRAFEANVSGQSSGRGRSELTHSGNSERSSKGKS